MTDPAGSVPPFPGFPGFPPAEMLDRMWGMMRLTPFGSAFPGSEPGMAQGFGPSLSMMSDMMAPLTNIEELDKRITDLRAVEQWLKLNLSMLQSSIQALEVQRATLSTLRAFGAFAQSQMSPSSSSESASPHASANASAKAAREPEPPPAAEAAGADGVPPPGFDASAWWNMLQSQFNQLAQFAMTQPAAAAEAAQEAATAAATAAAAAAQAGTAASANAKPAAKRSAGKTSAPRGTKKAPAQPE